MKEFGNGSHPLVPPAPQQAPQQHVQQPPPTFLQNPIPHQGVINTQQEMHPTPPQIGQYPHPNNPMDHTILLTSEEEVLLLSLASHYNGISTTARLGRHTIIAWSMTWHNLLLPCQF
jgi:hypothetical protein